MHAFGPMRILTGSAEYTVICVVCGTIERWKQEVVVSGAIAPKGGLATEWKREWVYTRVE